MQCNARTLSSVFGVAGLWGPGGEAGNARRWLRVCTGLAVAAARAPPGDRSCALPEQPVPGGRGRSTAHAPDPAARLGEVALLRDWAASYPRLQTSASSACCFHSLPRGPVHNTRSACSAWGISNGEFAGLLTEYRFIHGECL